MVSLSGPLLDTLIELVEEKLLRLSTARKEHSDEYRSLQDCRYELLHMAEGIQIPSSAVVKTVGHLTAIAGGKA